MTKVAQGMKNFGIIGVGGYIAPRHLQAIRDAGGQVTCALDVNDSVGIIDSYFPDANFFTEFERFDRHIDKLRRQRKSEALDYMTICSPNYLHDSHIRFALRSGTNAICEKPVVLNPWNIDGLIEIERDTGYSVNTILQLRLHPSIIALKERIDGSPDKTKFDVDLTYITSRGQWYMQSWKGDEGKSGGIATNIGVHFYDMLHFLFGELQTNNVHMKSPTRAAGYLEYARARVRWFLSIDVEDIPVDVRATGQRTYRSITMNGDEIEFSGGFGDLHSRSYEEIVAGRGFGLEENRVSITTVAHIRTAGITSHGEQHPFLNRR